MTNYGGIPEPYCNLDFAKIVVLPIPYDGTSTWGKGADRGPEALLEASANMELYDIETNSEVYLQGIYTAPPVVESSSPEKMTEAAYEATKRYPPAGRGFRRRTPTFRRSSKRGLSARYASGQNRGVCP